MNFNQHISDLISHYNLTEAVIDHLDGTVYFNSSAVEDWDDVIEFIDEARVSCVYLIGESKGVLMAACRLQYRDYKVRIGNMVLSYALILER